MRGFDSLLSSGTNRSPAGSRTSVATSQPAVPVLVKAPVLVRGAASRLMAARLGGAAPDLYGLSSARSGPSPYPRLATYSGVMDINDYLIDQTGKDWATLLREWSPPLSVWLT